MTNRKKALTDLLAKVEAGCHLPSGMISDAMSVNMVEDCRRAFNGSLDATLSLHDRVLTRSRFSWQLWVDHNGAPTAVIDGTDWATPECTAANPARAWLIAILRALIVLEGEGE